MKKIICLAMSIILLFAFAGCADEEGKDISSGNVSSGEAAQNSEDTSTLPDTSNEGANDSKITVVYATDEILDCYDSFFTYEDSASAEKIIIITEIALKNFSYAEIEYDIETGDANVKNLLFTINELPPEKPFVVDAHIRELIPNRGIIYTDDNNNTKSFMIQYSAMDGTLLLTEF